MMMMIIRKGIRSMNLCYSKILRTS